MPQKLQQGLKGDENPHLSVTQLKMYLRCPLQYFFRYVCGLKVPPTGDLTLGKTVHQSLDENYHQKIKSHTDLPISDVTDIFSQHWDTEAQQTLFQEDEKPGNIKDEGVSILNTYFKYVAPTVQPVDVEREFLVDTATTTVPIKGYIDLIDDQGCIIDHKTTKRSYPDNSIAKDIQLTAYAMAYRALQGRNENGVRLDVMVRSKQPRIQQLHGTRTEADIGRFLRLAEQVERGIKSGVFYPTDNYTCGICGYHGMCEKW
jgi:RecB family exonuclease